MSLDLNLTCSPQKRSITYNHECISWPPSIEIPNEKEENLYYPNISLEKLIKNYPDFIILFDQGEYSINNKLIKSFAEIIEIFKETKEKYMIFYISKLFSSKNVSLLSLILEPNVIDCFANIIENDSCYKIGVTSQIIINALEKWPYELLSTLYKSNSFFPSILKNIDKTSIYLLTNLLIKNSNNFIPSFIWGFYLSLMKDECADNPPSHWDISSKSISNCSVTKISQTQRLFVLRIINTFLSYFPNEILFYVIIAKNMPILFKNAQNDEEIAEILNISINIPTNPSIIHKVIKLIKKENINKVITEKAISYLAVHAKLVPICETINILFELIMKSIPNNFVFRSAANLIQKIIENHKYSSFFILAMQQIIAYCWNYPPHKSLMFRSFIIGYASIFGPICYLHDWPSFFINIVYPFSKWKPISKINFRFNEKKWNKNLLNSIRLNSVDIERYIKKKRRNSLNFELTSNYRHNQEFPNINLTIKKSESLQNLLITFKAPSDYNNNVTSISNAEICQSEIVSGQDIKKYKLKGQKNPYKPEKCIQTSRLISHYPNACYCSSHQNCHHKFLISNLDSNLESNDFKENHNNFAYAKYDTRVLHANPHCSNSHNHQTCQCSNMHYYNNGCNNYSYSYPSIDSISFQSTGHAHNSEYSASKYHSNLLLKQNECQNCSNKKRKHHQSSKNRITNDHHSVSSMPNTKTKSNGQLFYKNYNLKKRKSSCNIF